MYKIHLLLISWCILCLCWMCVEIKPLSDEKILREDGVCQSNILQGLPITNFRASSVHQPDSDKFKPYQARLLNMMEVDPRILSEAWCPAEQATMERKNWLEIDFSALHLVTSFVTKRRLEGNVDDFASFFIIQYQRENGSDWFTYQLPNRSQFVPGNVPGDVHNRQTIEFPFVARRVRIFPLQKDKSENFPCVKIMIMGCRFTDEVVEYRMPPVQLIKGIKKMGQHCFRDTSYDGSRPCSSCQIVTNDDNCMLQGGMGSLMDNKIFKLNKSIDEFISEAESNDAEDPIVWSMSRINIVLRFAEVREIRELHLFTSNLPLLPPASFRRLALRATLRDICPQQKGMNSNEDYDMVEEGLAQIYPFSSTNQTNSQWISVTVFNNPTPLVGRYLCLDFLPMNKLMILSEIRVVSVAKPLSHEEEQLRMTQELAEVTSRKTQSRLTTSSIPTSQSMNSDSVSKDPELAQGGWFGAMNNGVVLFILICILFLIILLIGSAILCYRRGKTLRHSKCNCCLKCCLPCRHSKRCLGRKKGSLNINEMGEDKVQQFHTAPSLWSGHQALLAGNCMSVHTPQSVSSNQQQWIDFIPTSSTAYSSLLKPATYDNPKYFSPIPPPPSSLPPPPPRGCGKESDGCFITELAFPLPPQGIPYYATTPIPPGAATANYSTSPFTLTSPNSATLMNISMMNRGNNVCFPPPPGAAYPMQNCPVSSTALFPQGGVSARASLTDESFDAYDHTGNLPSPPGSTQHYFSQSVAANRPSIGGNNDKREWSSQDEEGSGAISDILLISSGPSSCEGNSSSGRGSSDAPLSHMNKNTSHNLMDGKQQRMNKEPELPPLPPNHPSNGHWNPRLNMDHRPQASESSNK